MPDQQDTTLQSDNARQPVAPCTEVTREQLWELLGTLGLSEDLRRVMYRRAHVHTESCYQRDYRGCGEHHSCSDAHGCFGPYLRCIDAEDKDLVKLIQAVASREAAAVARCAPAAAKVEPEQPPRDENAPYPHPDNCDCFSCGIEKFPPGRGGGDAVRAMRAEPEQPNPETCQRCNRVNGDGPGQCPANEPHADAQWRKDDCARAADEQPKAWVPKVGERVKAKERGSPHEVTHVDGPGKQCRLNPSLESEPGYFGQKWVSWSDVKPAEPPKAESPGPDVERALELLKHGLEFGEKGHIATMRCDVRAAIEALAAKPLPTDTGEGR